MKVQLLHPVRGALCGIVAGLALGAAYRAIPAAIAADTVNKVATVRINITKSAFVPKEVAVAPGTEVIWINRDEMPHTVTDVDKRFASGGLDTEDQFATTFIKEGDYAYYCSVHPFMTGVVHVHKIQ